MIQIHFPTDPTAGEVQAELDEAGLKIAHATERVRREQWDAKHGPFDEDWDVFRSTRQHMAAHPEEFNEPHPGDQEYETGARDIAEDQDVEDDVEDAEIVPRGELNE